MAFTVDVFTVPGFGAAVSATFRRSCTAWSANSRPEAPNSDANSSGLPASNVAVKDPSEAQESSSRGILERGAKASHWAMPVFD
jgi:hypothetical protein